MRDTHRITTKKNESKTYDFKLYILLLYKYFFICYTKDVSVFAKNLYIKKNFGKLFPFHMNHECTLTNTSLTTPAASHTVCMENHLLYCLSFPLDHVQTFRKKLSCI